jgi:cytoskeleton protein RodZ
MHPNNEANEINESLGAFLRRARESKNVSIEQVAYATRISLKMLRALEEDDHIALPAPTFVRGYLQAYAKYVRIDTQDLRSHYLYVRERYQEKRRLVSAIVLFAVMLSVAGAFFFLKAQRDKHKRLAHTADLIQKSEEQKPAAPVAESPLAREAAKPSEKSPEKAVPEAAKVPEPVAKASEPPKAPVAVAPPPPAPAPKAPEPPKPAVAATPPASAAEAAKPTGDKTYQVVLKASEDVWFRYQTDEDEVKDLTLRSGKTMVLRANKVVKIFSGNLGAFRASLNGKELGPLGATKGVKSAVLPESEAANYKLPLFPQFQAKHAAKAADATQNSSTTDSAKSDKEPEPAPANP